MKFWPRNSKLRRAGAGLALALASAACGSSNAGFDDATVAQNTPSSGGATTTSSKADSAGQTAGGTNVGIADGGMNSTGGAGASGSGASANGAGSASGGAPNMAGNGGGAGSTQVVVGPLNAANKFAPPDGKTLLVIGQDTTSIEDYAAQVGPFPAGVMLYTSLTDLAGVAFATDFGAGSDDLGHWTNKSESFVVQLGLTLTNSLSNVPSGSLDANIDSLASDLIATHRPVFLRIGYEFDSSWANYEPNAYQAAYKHIVDHFRQRGASNVVFVWHAWGYAHSFNEATVEPWYPGDSYVDWVGVSYFPGWDSPSAQAADAAHEELASFAAAHGKPFMIAESAPKAALEPSLGANSWNGWYAPVLSYIASHNVKLFSYINADWDAQPMWAGQGWGDTRVQTNAYVLGQWKQAISNTRFLEASSGLYTPQ